MTTRRIALSGTTLAGGSRTLPDDLTRPVLVAVAYRQWQQRHVNTWLVVAEELALDFLEVPVLGRKWLPTRRFIDGGMASNMDLRTRQQTMCVYTDVRGFRRDLGIAPDRSDVHAMVVSPDGGVLWSAYGPATDESATQIRDALAT